MPLDYLILTPSSSVEKLAALISRFDAERRKFNLNIVHAVFDTGADDKRIYRNLVNDWQDRGYPLSYLGDEENCELWSVWSRLFATAKWQEFYYAIGCPDTLIPCKGFLGRSARLFRVARAADQRCIGIDIALDGTIAFIAEKKFFQILRFGIKANDRSDVWQGINARIIEANCVMANSKQKLILSGSRSNCYEQQEEKKSGV